MDRLEMREKLKEKLPAKRFEHSLGVEYTAGTMAFMYGVDYELKAVASQIVNGINYKFICISKIVVPYAQPDLVMMEVYTKFAHSVAPIVKVNKITKL